MGNELPRPGARDRFVVGRSGVFARPAPAEARRSGPAERTSRLLPDDADVSSAADEFRAVADRDQLERGFSRITAEQRAVLVLQHYAGLSQAEIADVLGVPIGTAGSRIHYAVRALRAALEADTRLGTGRESLA